ncbi:MAG: hypothetical protein CSA55_02480 [Ilumatobacter coccineus]|uniref:Uncharacterized protein n=1 Tax=Ilumatobacter coccineus TaxID=467094 RepID=A0A2G6KC94_9ACTN|nr:MAG: hypothetical protein CSA55_02480 [Ilumatobacter coccineus]
MRFLPLVITGALVASGCSSTTSSTDDSTSASSSTVAATTVPKMTEPATTAPSTTAPVPSSTAEPSVDESASLEWDECSDDVPSLIGTPPIECATLQVPLDYDDPEGTMIPIALIRQPALGDRIGALVMNPGGPGGSGIEFLASARLGIPAPVAERFDLVSFDPRGVGASASIRCDLTRDDGIFRIADNDRAAWDDLVTLTTDELATCTPSTDGLETRVGTNNAARDLDQIRAALGDDQLTYLGFSYGTRLGATYAELFPDRVRALVLDGGVLPSIDSELLAKQQGEGFDAALEAFAAACEADTDCLLNEFGPTIEVIDGLRAEIAEAGSFATDDPDRQLTPGELDLAILSALYSQSAWVYLSHALYVAEAEADGTLLQVLVDSYNGRQSDGTYSNQIEAYSFINCADNAERLSADEAWAEADAAADGSTHFGDMLRGSSSCLGMPDATDPIVFGPAQGAAPILVIGTTGDPATPYEWSQALADSLDSGVLYTVEGEGHTAYLGIDCVESVVNDYLVDLTVPEAGGRCTDDSTKDVFPPVGESDLEKVVAFVECLIDEGVEVDSFTLADALGDPSGIELFSDLSKRPDVFSAFSTCQSLLPS